MLKRSTVSISPGHSGPSKRRSNAAASDSLLLFDNTAVSQNKANLKTYFYYTDPGALFGGAGWRQAGTDPNIKRDTEVAFSLDFQCIFRKKGGTAGSVVWDMTPDYLPFP